MTFKEFLFHIKNIGIIKNFLHKNRLLVRAYFEARYRRRDPYLTATNPLEIEKLETTFNSIKNRHYKHILDIGCGEGYLVKKLIPIADKITALDISKIALNRARNRLRDRENIKFTRQDILKYETTERFDLIICSEVLFYLKTEDIHCLAERLTEWLLPNGYLLLVHIYGRTEDEKGVPLKSIGARNIHPIFTNKSDLRIIRHEEYPHFALTLLEKQ